MGADPAIAVRDLLVRRGGVDVLHRISVDVPAGTVTGLLGPSGCGKSTLMRSIVGVQIVASGAVSVLGQPAGSRSLRARVGYVTQAPSVYGDLSVRENLRYVAAVLGTPPERVEAVVETAGMNAFAGRVVGSLSGGQRARVSLATALLNEPPLLVLDEPTVGLDPLLRRDPRTGAMLLVVPCLLEVLLRYVLDGQPLEFQRVGTPLLGIFPFISMFVVTAITMLRERTTGTLERLMAMPLSKLDLLAGYGIAFGAVAAVQAGSP